MPAFPSIAVVSTIFGALLKNKQKEVVVRPSMFYVYFKLVVITYNSHVSIVNKFVLIYINIKLLFAVECLSLKGNPTSKTNDDYLDKYVDRYLQLCSTLACLD